MAASGSSSLWKKPFVLSACQQSSLADSKHPFVPAFILTTTSFLNRLGILLAAMPDRSSIVLLLPFWIVVVACRQNEENEDIEAGDYRKIM